MRYAIVIEDAGPNYSAYVPDLPGCVATGVTIEDVEREIREAIEFHIEGLREDGSPVPPPSSSKLRSEQSRTLRASVMKEKYVQSFVPRPSI